MQIGSLFSGIGGFDLAARWMGWETKWYSEIDPYACRVMEKHFGEKKMADPNGKRLEGKRSNRSEEGREAAGRPTGLCGGTRAYNIGDIREWTPTARDTVDVVCGGFPCQPVSLAGKRKAQDDERWLWPEFARVLGVLRPRYVVIENVPGLRSRGMDDVLRDLAKIGYDAEWTSLSASDVGAPHKRERVWIVAYPNEGDRRTSWTGKDQATPARLSFGPSESHPSIMAHPSGDGWQSSDGRGALPDQDGNGTSSLRETQQQPGVGSNSDVANTEDANGWRADGTEDEGRRHTEAGGRGVEGRGLQHWRVEPNVGRVAHGVPSRTHRLKCLGNAIVPQCAYEIFRSLQWLRP